MSINKTIASLLVSVNGWALFVWASPAHGVTSTEWGMLTTGLLATLGVYSIANAPKPVEPAPTIDPAAELAAAQAVAASTDQSTAP